MNAKEASVMLLQSDAQQAQVIEYLVRNYPEIRTSRWREVALKFFAEHEDIEDISELVHSIPYVPDGFVTTNEDGKLGLIFFEVEVFSPMSGDKLRKYGKSAIDFAYYDLEFSVLVVNKYWHINEVDLLPYYGEWLMMEKANECAIA